MCLAQWPQCSDTGEARTRGPSVSSQALYHWATTLPRRYFDTNALASLFICTGSPEPSLLVGAISTKLSLVLIQSMDIDKDSDKNKSCWVHFWVESHQSLIVAIFSEQNHELRYHYQTTTTDQPKVTVTYILFKIAKFNTIVYTSLELTRIERSLVY